VRRSVRLDDVPLALTCRKNTIAVVMPRKVLLVVLENGEVRLAKEIKAACSYTYDAAFAARNVLLTQGRDWSFNIINIQTGAVHRHVKQGVSTPFILSRREGWICGKKLYWMDVAADLGEQAAEVFALQEGVLVVMRSGALVLVRDANLDGAMPAVCTSQGWLVWESLDGEEQRSLALALGDQ
jgi:hypothetical protein